MGTLDVIQLPLKPTITTKKRLIWLSWNSYHQFRWGNITWKIIDYICAGGFIAKFIHSWRVYLGASKLFDTDHCIIIMDIKFPTQQQLKLILRGIIPKRSDIDVSVLRKDPQKREERSAKLDNVVNTSTCHQDINQHHEQIVDAVKTCLNDVRPNQET